jgi:hypothetical protein
MIDKRSPVVMIMPAHTTRLPVLTHSDAVSPIPRAAQQATPPLPSRRTRHA